MDNPSASSSCPEVTASAAARLRCLPEHARLGHATPLDGLRGFAVLAVVGHNLELTWLQGGFFGVDVFFALSGFLITTLLLEDYLARGVISLPNFARRRFFRLYPALILLVIASALSSLTRPEVELSRVGLVVASALLYFSNWVLVADSQAWVGGLGHTWSLAVEVHFYVLWALTLSFVTRRWGARLGALLALALGVTVASALWRVVVSTGVDGLNRAYAGTDTRFDAIFLGVAAALLRSDNLLNPGSGAVVVASWPRWAVRALECFLAGAVLWLINQTPHLSLVAMFGGFGLVGGATALLILTALLSPHSILARPLQNGVLVWFGQISYSLYLWHVPVKKLLTPDRFARFGLGSWFVEVIAVIVSIALAAASYYGVERAFLRLRRKARG